MKAGGPQRGPYTPRRWWAGKLDVEGLALHSVAAAAGALNRYASASGRFTTSSGLAAAAFDSFGHLRISGRRPQGFAPLSGFRRTGDGWIRLHANYPHHEQRLLQALGASSAAGAEEALRSMSALDAEAAIQGQGGIAAAVRTRGDWQDSAMGQAAGTGPWICLEFADGTRSGVGLLELADEATGSAGRGAGGLPKDGLQTDSLPPDGLPTAGPPLSGLRVLDLTRVIAGPVATRLLGALGADVLRIDPPEFPEIEDQFVDTAFGKRSVEADLTIPENQERLQQLLAGADVVVTGYRHGALDRFGLNPQELLAVHPGLVVVTLNSWGRTGPWRGLRGFDSIVQAACGIAHLYGKENDDGEWRPGALPVQALDHATGYGVAAAAVRLLELRRESGVGGAASLSLARTAEELFSLRANTESPAELPSPAYRSVSSSYGELRYVGPPLMDADRPVDYPFPPPPYGSSQPAWL